jgi:heterodisulfide reductase subunit A
VAKVGVYICKCGGTIADSLDFERVVTAAGSIEGVAVVRVHELYCGAEGQKVIEQDIKDCLVDRVVTVACSPKMHSKTFTGVCVSAGLNPYLLHMVNIREQGTWMTPDKEQATEKVIHMLRAGVARAHCLEPLEQKEIDVNADVMILGGGIAGVEAALELSRAGRKVFLVEKEPAFGGMLPKLEHTYPSGECAPCILAPLMKEVSEDDNITLLPQTTVKDVVGFGGNFTVTLEQKPRYVLPDACISCMMCIEECPAKAPNRFNGSMDERKAIDFPFPGGVPKAPYIDESICLRFKGEQCTKCKDVCDFGAIDFDQKPLTHEVNVGSIILAVGADVYDPALVYPKLMDGKAEAYSGLDFERICSTTGPTRGKILMRNGEQPQSIAIVHCVGSRTEKHLPYCSGVCCKYALKHSHGIKEKLPECQVTHIYSDLCIDGPHMQAMLDQLKHKGVKFQRWRMGNDGSVDIASNDGHITLSGTTESGNSQSIVVDMVILATGMAPNHDLNRLSQQLSLSENHGFVVIKHEKIGATDTTADGVFIVGAAAGPKDVTASVNEAKAAAGEALSTYMPGRKLKLEPAVAFCDPELCGGCMTCVGLCPYKAPQYDPEKKVVVVSEVLCKGCGTCVAACPTKAMQARHFTGKQILEEIRGVLG